MATMHVKVPHYVAAYYRNKDERKPVAIGKPVSLEGEPSLWNMMLYGLVRNELEEIIKEGCFCDRMWRKMLRGQSLCANNEGKYQRLIPKRDPTTPLTDTEVRLLCNLPNAHNEDSSEYLCITLPPFIYRHGKQVPIDGHWQLKSRTLQAFTSAMRGAFWNACLQYIDNFVAAAEKQGYEPSRMEGLERFMARYDIRNTASNREKMTLKRNYYRQLDYRHRQNFDFTEYGNPQN
jgi:hypothetical protein